MCWQKCQSPNARNALDKIIYIHNIRIFTHTWNRLHFAEHFCRVYLELGEKRYPIPQHCKHLTNLLYGQTDGHGNFIWIYWMFSTTCLHTHHSLLAKLGRWGRMTRMRLKEKPEDIIYIENITSNKTVSAGERIWFPTLPLLGNAESGKCRCVTPEGTYGGGGIPARWHLQPGR